MSDTAADYNKFRVTRNHDDIGHGELIIEHPGLIKIGGLVNIDLTADVVVGDYVEISEGVYIFTHKHHWNHSVGLRKDVGRVTPHSITIGVDVFIGVNAIILGGVGKIGRSAVIGAGAVVTKPVPAFEVWAGNPARRIGIRGEILEGGQ